LKYLFIAEKPSLMREVRDCYRNHRSDIIANVGEIDFIALAGHVCTNYEPGDYPEWEDTKWKDVQYPMIPKNWGVKLIPDAKKKKIVSEIKSQARAHDGIIVGTDSDQEGYGIYFLLEKYLGLQGKPALRFVEHSLTDSEIYRSLMSMTDYHKDPVHQNFVKSFLLRSRADWLFGMNCTRKVSVIRNAMSNIGRVKSEVIRIVYDNSLDIRNFRPKTFFSCIADYEGFQATEVDESGNPRRYMSEADIPDYNVHGRVLNATGRKAPVKAPKLFDMTSAQAEAGRLFGYSPAKTEDIIQSLYEKHKVISYPRTQCRYISAEKAKELPMMLSHMDAFESLAPFAKSVRNGRFAEIMKDRNIVNDREVAKESHDALLPTDRRPDPSSMTKEEINVCEMIFRRLLAHLLEPGMDDRTKAEIIHDSPAGTGRFIAKGRTVVAQGWRVLYQEAKENIMQKLEKDSMISASGFESKKGTTRPPKRLTQASLAEAMQNIASVIKNPELRKSLAESKGIGTPATRASIIESTITGGFVTEKKDGLYITDSGEKYISSISQLPIIQPEFAAQMDWDIKKVQRGEADYKETYKKIVQSLCMTMDLIDRTVKASTSETDIICPRCGRKMVLSRYKYECPGGDVSVSRRICGVDISPETVKQLCTGAAVGPFHFSRPSDGKKFDAKLKMESSGNLKFDFSSGIRCPKCGKDIRLNRGGAFCDSCGFKLFRNVQQGVPLSDAQLKTLVTGGTVRSARLKKRDGSSFSADLKLEISPEGLGRAKFIFR
jgi:DNA topoisomerase-3